MHLILQRSDSSEEICEPCQDFDTNVSSTCQNNSINWKTGILIAVLQMCGWMSGFSIPLHKIVTNRLAGTTVMRCEAFVAHDETSILHGCARYWIWVWKLGAQHALAELRTAPVLQLSDKWDVQWSHLLSWLYMTQFRCGLALHQSLWLSQFLYENIRSRQDSNLCGQSPTGF